jgi:hypothetical protein
MVGRYGDFGTGDGPTGIAIDAAAEIWVVNSGANPVSAVNSGTALKGSPFSGAGISGPTSAAINANANDN